MYRAILRHRTPSVHRGIVLVEGDDGLYLHSTVYERYGLGSQGHGFVSSRRISMTRLFLVDITPFLSPTFKLQVGRLSESRARAREDESDSESSEGDESAPAERASYPSTIMLTGGGGTAQPVHLLDIIASGVVGYSGSWRRKAWEDEIDRLWRNRVAESTVNLPVDDVDVKVPSSFARGGVMSMFVGQESDDYESVLSVYVYPLSPMKGLSNLLDITDGELMEIAYQVLGRNMSYSGAMYSMMATPRALRLEIAPTKDKVDPLGEALEGVGKVWEMLVTKPSSIVPTDPPLERRGKWNVFYELSPGKEGGMELVSRLSSLFGDGVVMRLTGGDEMFPRLRAWIEARR